MSLAIGTMPKKRPNPKGPPEPGPRRAVLQMKGSDEWKGWLDKLAKHLRMPLSTVVDHALIRYAKDMGFTDPPPER